MKKQRLCKLCRQRPAEVPDRDQPGRMVKEVCRSCHGKRLQDDLRHILGSKAVPPDQPESP